MNQVPHITEPTQIEKQYAIEAAKAADFGENWLVTANRALSIQNIAYQSACGNDEANAEQEQPLITAEEARKLGAGKVEWSYNDTSNRWFLCTDQCFYPAYLQYRAIKPKPVEPHAELKAMYEQQVNDGTFYNFVWEYRDKYQIGAPWTMTIKPNFTSSEYRCTPKPTCQIKNLVKLDGELMTREAAIEKYEAVKDKRDVWYKAENTNWLTGFGERFAMYSEGETIEYQLRAKPLKQASWASVPAGVAVICPLDGEIFEYKGVNGDVLSYYSSANFEMYEAEPNPFDDTQRLELAPASEQPWIAVQDDDPHTMHGKEKWLATHGILIEVHDSEEKYRITGLASGYGYPEQKGGLK